MCCREEKGEVEGVVIDLHRLVAHWWAGATDCFHAGSPCETNLAVKEAPRCAGLLPANNTRCND
eukprot:7626422-Pyramimonas_sp.AAC.1